MSHADDHAGTGEGNRRDFLYYATAGAGVVATGAAVWPLVNQMNPSADTRALASIMVDVSAVEVGTQLTVKWRGKPVFIRRRSPEEIEAGRAVKLDELVDANSENANKPDTDASDTNRTLDEAGEWLVMMGVCTHLGCLYGWNSTGKIFACPCHGSQFEVDVKWIAGPAPRSLDAFKMQILDASGNVIATSNDAGEMLKLPANADRIIVDTGAKITGKAHF